ncbi:MAG: lytic transglycosylase domain-containing protein [Saprospiraceae bacterium]|nr:lytic transglycosylase domain-containing protein [Saprospiraceae bacterium]
MKTFSAYTFILGLFFTYALFTSGTEKSNESTTTTLEEHRLPQEIRAVSLSNRSFDFAGEALPMENFDVRERLERELLRNSYYHSNTLLLVKRMKRFFPVIEPMLAEAGLPDDLKYLAVIESDLTNARSPAGAKGIWQFMKGTGQDYKLEINREVDERYHLEKATKAACKYLKRYHTKFGSWALTAAAYNMGPTGIQREINSQGFHSYYDLNLNQETGRYVFRIVAIKEILRDPAAYGFHVEADEAYHPLDDYNVVTVTKSIPKLGEFAKKYGITYRMLKVYNPWLVSGSLTISPGNSYEIKVPKQ